MLSLDVRGMDSVRDTLRDLAAEQVPFAMMTAINKVAFDVRAALQAEMKTVFDRPTPWILNQVTVAKATKQNLTAIVGTPEGIKDMYGNNAGFSRTSSSGVYERIISPHVAGGSREQRKAEQRLTKIGMLPAGWRVVPSEDAPLDSYGNLSAAWWVQLLSWVNAMNWSSQGSSQNRAEKTSKRKNKLERAGISVFIIPPWGAGRARSKLYPGLYLRQEKGGFSAIASIAHFVPSVTYRSRLDWAGVSEKTARDKLPDAMAMAIDKAMRTAR